MAENHLAEKQLAEIAENIIIVLILLKSNIIKNIYKLWLFIHLVIAPACSLCDRTIYVRLETTWIFANLLAKKETNINKVI